jgi:hypothetical protein
MSAKSVVSAAEILGMAFNPSPDGVWQDGPLRMLIFSMAMKCAPAPSSSSVEITAQALRLRGLSLE